MNEGHIYLKFDGASSRLAGNPYGRTVFEKQAKTKMNYEGKTVIEFPSQIENIASSFVQGFFAEIIAEIGKSEFCNRIEIQGSPKIVNKIMRSLGI